MVGTSGKRAIGLTAVLAEEFNQLHGGTYDPAKPPDLKDLYDRIHALPKGERRSALCLSGGGIRSASFALGVLQGLAARGILPCFHYLSTVSGGGYIGAWLSVWRRCVGDDDKLMKMLTGRRKEEADRLKTAYRPDHAFMEPVEVSRLRAHSNFLTPKLGAMSADTWALVALYLRNLLLNWAVYLPLIVAVLLTPVLSLAVLHAAQRPDLIGFHHVVLIGAIALFVLAVFTSVRGRLGQKSRNRVGQGTFLILELLPIYLAALLVCVYAVGRCNNDPGFAGCWGRIDITLAAIIGAAIYYMGWVLAFACYGDHSTLSKRPRLSDPFPPVLLWLPWTAAGGIAGALVGWGLELATTQLADPTRIVVFGVGWVALSIFLANAVYLALTSLSALGDVEREWLARSSGWFVAMTVVWAGLAGLVLYSGEITRQVGLGWSLLVGGGAGAIAARIGSSARTLLTFRGKAVESLSMTTILSLAAVVFLIALAVVLSNFLPSILAAVEDMIGWGRRPVRTPLAAIAAAIAFVAIVSYFVNVNRFSAHGLYRNRLIRAFLGSARGPEAIFGDTADPFTGFDRNDNVWVRDLVMPKEKGKTRLFPVINMALNMVAGANNAWQERKAASFTVSPLYSGNEWVDFWPTDNYGSHQNGLALGTAIAISGAAASPNQGYHSSPLVGLVMTLFNVRLGWWLGNPSWPQAAPRESPPFSMVQFIWEMFGLTNDRSSYVYLSDGGHFENLGLYEMVRRRCHFIVVSDAGCDPDCAFADLGNAVRKIGIDLGVKIVFRKILVEKRGVAKPDGVYCAVGTITYPEGGPEGHLIYLKPGYLGSEPADIRAYASANKDFPHETTADQFFSESQMESYRALGEHVVGKVFGDKTAQPHAEPPISAMAHYWENVQHYA